MARYLTRGAVALLDGHPDARVALEFPKPYTPRTLALVGGKAPAPDADSVARSKKGTPTIDEAFKMAAGQTIPWVVMRRDLAEPVELLGQLLEATGRRATKDLPGFAALLVGPPVRPITRILAVVDLSDGDPSGLMTLVAVATAQATGAILDVLVLGAPGKSLTTPRRADDIMRITRDKDLYEQARRRADEQGDRATWVLVEDPGDRTALVLDQVATGGYDLVIEDLGAVKLGARIGRGRRIQRALAPGSPGSIVRALLEVTDVPLAVVLDAVRLGVLPPGAVKGGAGALLAVGILASAAPAASASTLDRAQTQASVSQSVDAYDAALDEAANMAAPVDVAAATQVAEQSAVPAEESTEGSPAELTEASPAEESTAASPAEESTAASPAEEGDQTESEAPAVSEEEFDEQAPAEESTADETGVESIAPSELAPEDVTPAKAAEVSADSGQVAEDVDSGDVSDAEDAQEAAAEELADAEEEFDAQQEAAIDSADATVEAAEDAEAAQADLAAAESAYQETYAETELVISDATGVSGALPGGASEADLAAAEQAQADALADVQAAETQAADSLEDYQSAATQATEDYVELEAAAADVTDADAVYQEAAAVEEATEAAYQEAMADARVSPVPGYEITTAYGVPGDAWSTGYHTGVDYAAPEGTDVVAAGSGTVVYAQNDGGAYGNRIVIEHDNGYYTTYNHLSQIDVQVGQEVTAGENIGEVGNTGNSFGAHLHFEVTKDGDGWGSGSFVDPAQWLSGEIG